LNRSQSLRTARHSARHVAKSRAPRGELLLKMANLLFEALGGLVGMKDAVGQVPAERSH